MSKRSNVVTFAPVYGFGFITTCLVLFWGTPDIHDAIIFKLMQGCL